MSILDDAIREHLELKRAHGADESEVKRLEDEAFGPAERPDQLAQEVDPFAEAPTEFLSTPQDAPEATPTDPPSGGRELPNFADLQEPPPPKPVAPEQGAEVTPEESAEDADTEGPSEEAEGPSEEQHPAMEHPIAQPAAEDRPAPPSDELQPDPEAPGADAPSAAERNAAAEQPTELFDVEGQFEDTATELEVTGPPREDPEDEFDEFFSEQRLSDELNQALEAPLPDEPGAAPERQDEPEDSAEYDLPEESGEQDAPDHPRDAAEAEGADEYQPHEPGHADALEDTPEFLEESPEDDDAWFEQRPPKDFDFGD